MLGMKYYKPTMEQSKVVKVKKNPRQEMDTELKVGHIYMGRGGGGAFRNQHEILYLLFQRNGAHPFVCSK